jgi:V/A-type H+-transporting ATPase subunit F
MKKILFITPEDARFGFTLSGVRQLVTDPAGAAGAVAGAGAVAEANTGLIFIDERLYRHLDEEWLDGVEKRWPGLLIVLPAPEKLAELPADYAMELIAKAIGYQVRLQI